ncbi:MAG: PD-(D/E)XK nuclease family protein, partial [Candidatus Cryptobacteroides sp.]
GFGLPTYEYQDAVWAYYFYRLISRAETVWMLYDSRTEGLKSGEESRYIKQLRYHFNADITTYSVKGGKIATGAMPQIEKTEEHVGMIRDMCFSASSIQTYLTCPAKFYYSCIEKIEPEVEVAESLDSGMFGTVYHETMQAFYTGDSEMGVEPGPEGVATRERLKGWLKRKDDIRRKVDSLIMKQLNVGEISGRNLVVSDVIVKYVMKTIKTDLDRMTGDSFIIRGLELKLFGEIAGRRFIGFIDRLDSMDEGTFRVVDYKTGKVLADDENITCENAERIANLIFEKDIKDRPKIALQCFIYDELLRQKFDLGQDKVVNCIYSTARLFREPPVETPENSVFSKCVTENLRQLFEEMENPAIPFSRTERTENCNFCDFKIICGR